MKWDLKFKTNFLLGLFVASLVAANLIGSKIAQIGFVHFSVGIFAYPITFLITDMIEEVFGREKTKMFVKVGFWCMIIVLLMTVLAVALPFAERSYVQAEQYNPVFGISIRFLIASVTAFIISQMHDIWAFNFWKQKTKGRFLWLRNNASTIVSQLIDTVIFMFIALYYLPFSWVPATFNTSPKFNVAYMFALIMPYWTLKMVVALFDTPFIYLGVKWLTGKVYSKKTMKVNNK
jgi:uncharacterized integral membrane protein (TIGR00697 family)